MRSMLVSTLAASLGSTIMWLLLVPYFGQVAQSSRLVGLLGMERQIAMLFGSLIAGAWADSGRVIQKFALLEAGQLGLALVFLVTVLFSLSVSPAFVLIWTGLRFVIVGATTVVAYRLLADLAGSGSKGAVAHMVTSPQGAMVFASIICVLIPVLTSRSMVTALIIDALTAGGLVVFLCSDACAKKNPSGSMAFRWRNMGADILSAVRSFWLPELRPWSVVQICFLIGLSGMMVYGYAIAESQSVVPVQMGFAASWFFYGLAFWLTAPLLRNAGVAKLSALLSAGALIACGLIGALVDLSHVRAHAVIYVVLTLVNAFWLHYTNAQILRRAPSHAIGKIRASMLLYLGVVFGFGEQVAGIALTDAAKTASLGMVRLVVGLILLIAVVVWDRQRDTVAPAPARRPQEAQ
jgi:MFS family permease